MSLISFVCIAEGEIGALEKSNEKRKLQIDFPFL